MSQPSREQYLESKVFTASQPQLHIMLLEGALQFGRQAQTTWAAGANFAEVDPLLERMSNIVDELTHGMSTANESLSQQLEEQYAFIYRELAACRINVDQSRLEACLDLLAYQRETWKLACERLDSETPESAAKARKPHVPLDINVSSAGISLEA